MTNVVNVRTENCDVYIGRGSIFGNTFTHLKLDDTKAQYKVKTRQESIDRYHDYFYYKIEHDPEFLEEVMKLKDKKLGCYCQPLPCHGQIIADFIDGRQNKSKNNFI